MARKGKRLNKAREGLEAGALYSLEDAVTLLFQVQLDARVHSGEQVRARLPP